MAEVLTLAGVYFQLLNKCLAVVVALALPGVATARVQRRKLPRVLESTDGHDPICIVTPREAARRPEILDTGGVTRTRFAVDIVVVRGDDMADLDGGEDVYTGWQEALERAFQEPFDSEVPGVVLTDVESFAPMDRDQLAVGIAYTGITAVFETIRERT